MQLYLFRHGIAVDRADPDGPPDAERALTARGRDRTRAAAQGLLILVPSPELILTSPYVRAMETAEILRDEIAGSAVDLEQTDALLPAAAPGDAIRGALATTRGCVVCVGHAPNLDLIAAALIGCRSGEAFRLKKAGAAGFEVAPDGSATLLAVLPPRVLRALAESGRRRR